MKKTPCVFTFDHEKEIVLNEVRKGCEWVFTDQSMPTLKVDGTACLFKDGKLWKRYDRKLLRKYTGKFKAGDQPDLKCFKTPPEGAFPCEESFDPNTFHWPYWTPVLLNEPSDQFYVEALAEEGLKLEEGSSYELIGKSVAGNAYDLKGAHKLVKHGAEVLLDLKDVSFEGIKQYLTENYIEGIVFHNKNDGRLAKITRRHFGLFWKEEPPARNKRKIK